MSRKHFRLIAEAIKNIPDENTRKQCAERIAEACAACNPRFSFSVFYSACNVNK